MNIMTELMRKNQLSKKLPALPMALLPDTCDFCGTLFGVKYEKFSERRQYCKKCINKGQLKENVKKQQRYNTVITDPQVQEYITGVFESFVAETERATTVFGVKTFDTLYREIKQLYPYLSEHEYIEMVELVNDCEKKFGKYVDLVMNEHKFTEIGSSGKREQDLKTPGDWASAISNLIRILTLANQWVELKLESFLGQKAFEKRVLECKKYSSEKCQPPCVIEKGIFGPKCTYKGSLKYKNKGVL